MNSEYYADATAKEDSAVERTACPLDKFRITEFIEVGTNEHAESRFSWEVAA